MNRVEISMPIVGITAMQVCAISDATDEEILEVCNRENPSGTEHGWTTVFRKLEDVSGIGKGGLPGNCEEYPERVHFLIFC